MDYRGEDRAAIEQAKQRYRNLTSGAVDARPHDAVMNAARKALARSERPAPSPRELKSETADGADPRG